MTTINTKSAILPTITGKGMKARKLAFARIAPQAYSDAQSFDELCAIIGTALGNAPSDKQRDAARDEFIVGRMAFRLPAGEVPAKATDAQRIEHARSLVHCYATPAKPNTTPRKLRAGQIGRRSIVQQRCYGAAKESWSQVLATIGLGKATTNKAKAKAKAKRAPSMAGSGKGMATPTPADAATLAQLATPAAAVTADDYVSLMQTTLSMLIAYDNKHANIRPVTHGKFAELLGSLRSEGNDAANAYQVRKAKDEAAKADAEPDA